MDEHIHTPVIVDALFLREILHVLRHRQPSAARMRLENLVGHIGACKACSGDGEVAVGYGDDEHTAECPACSGWGWDATAKGDAIDAAAAMYASTREDIHAW